MLGGVPAFGLIVFTAAEQRRLSAAQVQENSLRMARLASATQERLIEGARQVLLILSRMPEVRGDDAEAANALLAEILGLYPLYANFGVVNLDGSVFASGLLIPGLSELDLSDRAYVVRALEREGFAMGDYQIGRITGIATVNFGHPVRDGDGRIIRIVYSALDLKWLEELAEESDLPAGAMLLVVDKRGTQPGGGGV